MVAIIILFVVFLLITLRRIGNLKFEMWQIMIAGSLINIMSGTITISEAFKMVDWNIIFFLFCMFSIGSLLEISGYLNSFYSKLFISRDLNKNFFIFVFVSGFLSAFLMNDTVAIIIVPLISYLSKKHQISTRPLIIGAAFSITIGSVMSPIGNPQNFLIAISSNMKNPFYVFIKYLFIPTILNLVFIYWFIKLVYKREFLIVQNKELKIYVRKSYFYSLSKLTVGLLLGMIILKIYLSTYKIEIPITLIAGVSAIPSVIFSFNQLKIFRKIDWKTLIFFIGMFIIMRTAWESGYIQKFIFNYDLTSIKFIFLFSLILSQFISNVPLVVLFLPILINMGCGEIELISLACASTISGNLTVLGAASNVIIIQNLESRKMESISSIEFMKLGLPITLINSIIYYIFLFN
ncbi:MAG: SLC13 family permease [Elusimicrobiales bacterium]|nr:SLC13 family permease [Elusimicrobiales bacterium]